MAGKITIRNKKKHYTITWTPNGIWIENTLGEGMMIGYSKFYKLFNEFWKKEF